MDKLQITRPRVKVLFVCLGNICRSPMAEAVFAQMVRQSGLENAIEIDSAGTGNWHAGKKAHHGTLDILRQQNIPYDGRARQITQEDIDYYDYIVTMDESNLADVIAMGTGHAQIVPLLSFAPQLGITEVPDPYYHGGFDKVFDMIQESCRGLLEHIRKSTFKENLHE